MHWHCTFHGRFAVRAFSLVEALVAGAVLGVMALALFGGFASGLAAVRIARENTRATQILMQKMETFRLFTWSQLTNTTFAPTNFVDWYDPSATNTGGSGTLYSGFVSVTPAPATLPQDYRSNMCTVTVTLFWTNYPGGTRKPLVQSRQAQSYVARYGMQEYIY